jgi:rhodanese-related sulfurtransferase
MPNPTTLAGLLETARRRLDRIAPDRLQDEMDAGALVVDVRDSALRHEQGALPGARVIDLTILEWRLAPSSENRDVDLDPDQRVVLVCSEGFSSSLAAARLQDLGIVNATDLEGGFKAWDRWRRSV